MTWKERVAELRSEEPRPSWREIYEIIGTEYFEDENQKTVEERIRGWVRRQPEYKMEHKYGNIPLQLEPNYFINEWSGDKVIRFGVMGDTQINSKYTQLTHLHKLYDIYEQEGIETVFHTGDIDEGEEMRMGHKYECYTQGADDHVAEIVRTYPKRKNMVTKFITGNHDHSLYKRAGYDIGNTIDDKREDMIYLGMDSAVIELTPNCTCELRHPGDGTAYALSYKIQKMIESMSGGEKPNILCVGHYHKTSYDFYRNVHAIQSGCFQGQTPFTRSKGISISVGGWIIEIQVDDEGTINRFKPEFIPFYKHIKDDYMNWR